MSDELVFDEVYVVVPKRADGTTQASKVYGSWWFDHWDEAKVAIQREGLDNHAVRRALIAFPND